MANIRKVFLKLFHCIVLVQYLFAIYYDLNHVKIPVKYQSPAGKSGFGRTCYLTYWSLVSIAETRHKILIFF